MSSSASVKSLLNKATKDDREPASGFILQELATRSNSIEECKTMYETILKKLNKDKPNIKKKCLRVICFVSENGSSQWRRYWQGQTDKIKECSRYSGRADPIYGDTPYKDVRELAAKTMEAIFSSTRKDTSAIASRMTSMSGGGDSSSKDSGGSSGGGRLSSIKARFSSGSFGVRGGAGSSSDSSSGKTRSGLKITTSRGSGARTKNGRELEGFGNTDYRPDPARIAEAKFTMLTQSPAYANPGQLGGDKHPWSTGELDTKTTRKGKRKKRTAGGVFADDSDGDGDGRGSRRALDESDDGDDDGSAPSKRAPTRREAIRSDGKFERQWVDSIVTGGGVGVKIPDLKSKIQQFETLSQGHVLEYLDDKLKQDTSEVSWQALAKCLVLLTSLIKDGNSPDSVIDYFSDSPENVAELMQHKKAILRKHANVFADLVGISLEEDDDDEAEVVESPPLSELTSATQSTEPSTSIAVETADDLFGFATGVGASTAAATATVAQSSGTDDLLHGLTISGDGGTTAAASTSPATGTDDLFGGMNVGGTGSSMTVTTSSGIPIEISSPVSTTAAVSAAVPAAVVPLAAPEPKKDDIFGTLMADPMMGLSTTTATTAGPSGDLSGILGGSTAAVSTSVAATTATQLNDQSIFGIGSGVSSGSSMSSTGGGSGFGFVSSASASSPGLGGMGSAIPSAMSGLAGPTAAGSGYAFGGGAAPMMGGPAGMGGQPQWHATGAPMAHPSQAYGQAMLGGMHGGGMMGGMSHGMMASSPGLGGMMTQPPASHPLFSSGGSMGGGTTAGVSGMGSYGMGSSSRMGGADPFATMMNPAPPAAKAPTEPDPFADLGEMIKM